MTITRMGINLAKQVFQIHLFLMKKLVNTPSIKARYQLYISKK